jgi:PAS domain S-box-containing protein
MPNSKSSDHIKNLNRSQGALTSERRKTEELTQAASQYARSLLEASLDPLVTISAEGKITDVNTATEQVTGVGRESLIGSDFAEYFTDPQKAREGYQQVFLKGSVTDYPLAIRHATGKLTDVLYNASLYRDASGNVLGVFAAARDITAYKKSEAIVRDSVRRFTTALANSKMSVWEQDLQLRYTWFYNPKLGYGLNEVIGKTDAELMEPAYAKELETLKRRVIETEQPVRQEVATAAPNSPVEFYDLSIEPLRDVSGHVVGITCTATEVTERRQAEEITQAASQYARSLLEASLDPLVTISAEGKITDVNTATEQVTGVGREILIGSDFADYFTDPQQAREGYQQVFLKGSVTDYPLAIRHVSGKITDVIYNASVYRDANGNVLGVFAAARDITQSKQLGQALSMRNVELEKATAVAEEASLAKSQFLSSMSHELRTPLNAILGFAQLIESNVSPPTPSQKRSLDQILSAGWYLLELVNEILDLAQIESGKAVMMREAVPLEHIMSECQELVEPLARKRGIEVSFPRMERPHWVEADLTRTRQVLINLLHNAIKYNKPGGTVSMTCTLVPPNSIRISVRDTGLGLSPEQLGQLFQPFNRLGRESGAEQGTGIGLVVVKRLVELMGGVIDVESQIGVGSVFSIELNLTTAPLLTTSETEQTAPHSPKPTNGTIRRTVLYVEDNPANLALVEELLTRRPDLRLISAADGNLGVEYARTYLPDVILMDLHLPGISGIEAMKALRADLTTAHIPVIALSAQALPADIIKAMEAGFVNYITKPIKLNDFMAALDVALGKRGFIH